MKYIPLFISVIVLGLSFTSAKSQSFFEVKNISFSVNYGYGKILWYHNGYSPALIGAADDEAAEYSPSWSFKFEKCYWLNNRFDFSIGLSHLTITEKTHQTAKPHWFGFDEKNLMQGFIHVIPNIRVKLPDDRFTFNLGLRMGTAAFFGSTTARESSHSLGEVNADIDIESGASVLLSKKLLLEVAWIHGLTKYDYAISMPVVQASFYKYHSFQFGIRYILRNGKKVK